jgi:hypoxanthine phosphoribosyltransferase
MQPSPVHHPQTPREHIAFSHPSEQEFARILDFYGISWRYEATTFPLRWDDRGQVMEAFTPDFYLVDQSLYVELTTLRQKLMRLKHQKIRRIHELYPDVRVRLWDRADIVRLLEHYGQAGRGAELVGKEAIENGHAHAQ